MDCRERLGAFQVIELSANLGDAFLDSKNRSDCRSAEATDQARLDGCDLAIKERRARFNFVRQRRAVARRTAFYHVADVNFLAFHSDELDHPVQQLPGTAHERQALSVFIGARTSPTNTSLA